MPTSPYQVYSAGQRIQQGPGNRYIPPTYNWRDNGRGSANNYREMDWNNVQSYGLPQQQNDPYTPGYMSNLRGALGGFGDRYPRQGPQMPNFGGRGGGDIMRDAMIGPDGRSIGRGPNNQLPGGGLPEGDSYDQTNPNMEYTAVQPPGGGRWAYGPNGERIEVGGRRGPDAMYNNRYDRLGAYDYARTQPWFDQENYGGGMGGPVRPQFGGNGGFDIRALFEQMFGGGRGGQGGGRPNRKPNDD